jgi:hypothetical protein
MFSTRTFLHDVWWPESKFNTFYNHSEVNENVIKDLSHIIRLEHISSVKKNSDCVPYVACQQLSLCYWLPSLPPQPHTILLTNTMMLSSSSSACSAGQQVRLFLWNHKDPFLVQRIPLLNLIMILLNPDHILPLNLINIHVIMKSSSNERLWFQCYHLPSGFQSKIQVRVSDLVLMFFMSHPYHH